MEFGVFMRICTEELHLKHVPEHATLEANAGFFFLAEVTLY
jgi:hypothetical protein